MTEETGLIDLHLVEPRQLLLGVEDLDRHVVPLVHAPPHLPEASLPDEVVEGDLARDGALDEQWEPRAATRVLQEFVETRVAV